jgi:poly-gamma-glutamate capsule biosynthesis protein CapA/YwtB (metallophosphatase superfamily)
MVHLAGRTIHARGRRAASVAVAAVLLLGVAVVAGEVAIGAISPAAPAVATLAHNQPLTAGGSPTPDQAPSSSLSPVAAIGSAMLPGLYPSPVVPIESFWGVPASIGLLDLGQFWSGRVAAIPASPPSAGPFTNLVVSPADADALSRYFGSSPGPAVEVLPADDLLAAVGSSPATLGLIRAEDLTPGVRALAIDGVSIFGPDRSSVANWRLNLASDRPSDLEAPGVWTLAAGGDVNLDRRVYVQAVAEGHGADYPWSGGAARIVGPLCCGRDGAQLVVARSTGVPDALRSRFRDADLALVNFEGSAPDDYEYRPDSLVFTFDPALLAGLRDTGIDAVSLANNHIRNGGDQGVLDTCRNLDRMGIGHAGAGANSTDARVPAWLSTHGLRVAVLAYSAVGSTNWASRSRAGAAALQLDQARADIRAARAAGADIVVVMPHWGIEYSDGVSAAQKAEARAFVAAGADLVLGSHSHWTGAIQSMPGPNGPAFVDYSMGDLLFDLNHDARSQEGEVVTLSFVGRRLVQVQIDPTVMIGGAQVGLLDPATGGRPVMTAIKEASRGLIDW